MDGANGSSGRFCLTIRAEPDLWLETGTCATFTQPAAVFPTTGAWRNLYTSAGPHVTGALLGAIRTEDDLGTIAVSTEILPEAPVLPNGQKIIPRYFNFETEFAPVHPVTLRLFFTAADLEAFNITPPASAASAFQLGLTHYDGDQEDCDPTNNVVGGGLTVNTAQATLVGADGLFFLESVFNNFSEFGAALAPIVATAEPSLELRVLAYPNPFDNALELSVFSPVAGQLEYRLFDVLGAPAYQGNWDVRGGENKTRLELPGLVPGMYHLVFSRNGLVVGRMRVAKL